MSAHYGTRVRLKAETRRMKAAAAALELGRILKAEQFMERYTTVVGRTIYTPWVVGASDDPELSWRQAVVCVHEHQHIVQYRREGDVSFGARYLISSRQRALFEAEAYQCNIEMHWWRHGALPDLDGLAGLLKDYGCGAGDIAAAREVYEGAAARISRGEVITEASQWAMAWLESRG